VLIADIRSVVNYNKINKDMSEQQSEDMSFGGTAGSVSPNYKLNVSGEVDTDKIKEHLEKPVKRDTIEEEVSRLHDKLNKLESKINNDLKSCVSRASRVEESEDSDKGGAYSGSPIMKELKVANSRIDDLRLNIDGIIERLDLGGEFDF
jgi:hypothetical protein